MKKKTQNNRILKVNKSATKIFKDYLKVRDENKNLETFDCVKFDEMLAMPILHGFA